MIYEYLKYSVFAGVIAGIAYGVFIAIVMNPLIHYMEGLAHHGHEHTHAVTETTTTIVSIGSGVLWGILLGGLFGFAFYFLEPALPGTGRIKAFLLAGAAFFIVSVVPWLVLPPVAPEAEHALQTDIRLLLYGGLIVVGAATVGTSLLLYQRTVSRGRLKAIAVGMIPVLAIAIVIPLATPALTTTGEIPLELVTTFQGLVILGQLALWMIIAVGFNWFQDQSETPTESTRLDDEMSMNT